jgi:CheY-like chemotaxis protein
LGKGSNFYFHVAMPVYKKPDAAKVEKRLLSVDQLKNLKVLVAEDNPINMMVAKKVLQKWNVQVSEAVNGGIAVEKCIHEHFDVVLMDLEMPVMDGRTALKEISKLNKSIPCIAFTAGIYENMKTELKEQGFIDYLPKPFKPEDLYKKIITVLQQKVH